MENRNTKLLTASFVQINGISYKKERDLWDSGIMSLDELKFKKYGQLSLFDDSVSEIDLYLGAIENDNPSVFLSALEKKEFYRVAYSFPKHVIFLDIETTGLSSKYHYITMVGWMKDGIYDYWIQGTSTEKLFAVIESADLIITFNGILFDCKFLDEAFCTNLFSSKPNLDLMHLCRRYNLTGGQKQIEIDTGFIRSDNMLGINGKEAIALWYEFLFGDNSALLQLIKYNYFDIIGMTYILDWVFYNSIYGVSFPIVKDCKTPFFFLTTELHIASFPNQEMCQNIRNYIEINISNFNLDMLSDSENNCIIGIDLAGKIASRTGICVLKNNEVQTHVLHTNDEIISYVLTNQPDLISIDAPLSLPKGRISVYDDDPNRESGGILRVSERVLKKRGINSYPALIRSMQELTKRGIELSYLFRHLGYPVIECFPGAAQDIIQIPRKRTDESLLKRGLSKFGIQGDYKNSNVCHDELDAVTASLVGRFFISGYYEAIGIPEENDMIIPKKDLAKKPFKIIIGICGLFSSGKTTVSKYIKNRHSEFILYSYDTNDNTNDEPINSGDIIKRSTSQENYTFSKNQYEINKAIEHQVKNERYLILDGMRYFEDYTYWKEKSYNDFYLIYIDTNNPICYEQDQHNIKSLSAVNNYYTKTQTHNLIEKANIIINNSGSLNQLYKQIDSFLTSIKFN